MRIPLVILAAGLMAAACGPARAAERGRPDPRADRPEWTQLCAARAAETGMRRSLRGPFVTQCVAGYRINHHGDQQGRK